MLKSLLIASYILTANAAGHYPRAGNASSSVTSQSFHGTLHYNASIPATGTGMVYASSCNAAKQDWLSRGGSELVSTTTYTSTSIDSSVESHESTHTSTIFRSNATSATPYTLCDGWPRLDAHTEVSTSTLEITHTLSATTWTNDYLVYHNLSAPTCSIQSSDCASLNTSWYELSSAWSVYRNSSYASYLSQVHATTTNSALTSASTPVVAPKSTITEPPQMTDEFPPQCGAPTYPYTETMIGDPTCFENHAHIELLYWPVVRLPENETCPNATSSTLTMGPTISGRPNTFVYWNTTLTSPTVSPDAVSTLAGKLGGGYHPPEKINYADFNYPVPASAYRAQPRCYEAPLSWSYYSVTQPLYSGGPTTTWEVATYSEFASENQCSTIYDDYRPILSIPPEFSSLTPAAQRGDIPCPFSFGTDAVFFDPPKALTQAGSLDGVSRPGGQSTDDATTTKEAPSQSAEPGTLPGPETPSATLTSETTAPSKTMQAKTSANSERPETSAENGSQVQTTDPTGSSSGDAQTTSEADPQTTRDPSSGVADGSDNGNTQLTSEADPQTTRDPVSGVADGSDNGATRTNTAGAEEDDQSQVQTSAGISSATTQGGADSQPSSDGSGATAGSTTSRNVGEIIASALGMTATQSAESSPTSTGTGDGGGDAQDPDTQDATESVEDSDPASQASDGSSGGASGTSASEGSQGDNAGSSPDGNVDNTSSDSDTAGTSGDQGSSDTASDGNASAGSSSGDSGSQRDNAESASTEDVDNAASSSDNNNTAGDQSSSATGSEGNASAESSNGHSDSSSNDGVNDSAQGQTGSNSGSGSSNHASGSQTVGESSGTSSAAGNVANGQDDDDEGSSVDSDSSGSQAGDTGSSDSDSMGQFSSYRAAVLSGLDTTIAIASAKSGGAVVADATLSAGESTSIPGIGNVIAISSGVIADGSTEVFSAIGTGAPESGRMTGAVLSRPSDSAITISQGSGEGAIIGSVTLSSGEQTHVSGIGNIVVQPSGVVVDGSTQAYSAITSSPESDSITNGDARAQEFTIDGKTYTASSATGGDVVIANDLSTATLDAAGDLATLGTVILSAGSSGHLVLGSSTVSVTAAPTASASTAGQQTFTAGSDGDYLIGSQTLTAGGAVTMSGTTYSRPTSGSGVVVDGMTQGFETGQRSESVSRSTEPSGSTSTSSTTGQEGSNFIVPGATAENTTPASGGGRVSTVGGVAGIVVAMALLNAM
ncbi:hypothetical protein D0860_05981 [Hortaea werneckii]|uniref:Uncharacterized protein n=1 Tax=Hortaea werneckii TaxID=91943 RepID=A0A3M7GXH8_HORWE|nr:hypothetical protein D0860_05981 [Hortaea werneckii]